MKNIIFLLVTLLCIPFANAGLQEGIDAYKNKDWAIAIPELEKAASQSSKAAELLSDYHYSRASWNDETVKWSLMAAKLGDASLQHKMGVRIDDIAWRQSRRSHPIENKNFQIAAECFQLAADQGHAYAQNALGMMYDMGLKIPQNIKKSIELYKASAKQGNSAGLQSLATMYSSGRGVEKDLLKAYTLFLTSVIHAKANDDTYDFSNVLAMSLEQQLSKSDVEKAKSMANSWIPGQPLSGLD